MPYTVGSSNLPAHVKKMPAKKRRQWVHVWNSTYDRTHDEGKAFAAANGVAGRRKKEADVGLVTLVKGDRSAKVTMFADADDPDLPAHVKGLPVMVRSRWVNNHNWSLQETLSNEKARARADEFTTLSLAEMMSMKDEGLVGDDERRPPTPPPPDEDDDDAEEVEDEEDEENEQTDPRDGEEEAVGAPAPPQRGGVGGRYNKSLMARVETFFRSLLAEPDDTPNGVPVLPGPALAGSPPVLASLSVYKGSDDQERVLLVYSNIFKDKHREIISTAAHEEYAASAEAGEAAYPDLHLWHGGPGTKWGTVETISFVDGFAVAGGVVDPGKEHVASTLKELADKGELAVSFGFYGLRGPDAVYHLYRPFEISPLPAGSEANPWTGVPLAGNSVKESDMAFSDKKKTWFKTHFKMSDEQIADAEQKFGAMASALKTAGVDYKEREPTPEPTPPAPEPPSPPPQPPPPPPSPATAATAAQFAELAGVVEAVTGLATVVKALQDDLKAYKEQDAGTVNERANEQVLARIAGAGNGHSPTKSSGNVQAGVKEQDDNWLDAAIGTIVLTPGAQVGATMGHVGTEGS